MSTRKARPSGNRPTRAAQAEAWALDPALVFLNHGSFGACPRAVLVAQAALRDEMEANPVAFLGRALEPRLDAAREALGAFLGRRSRGPRLRAQRHPRVNSVLRRPPSPRATSWW